MVNEAPNNNNVTHAANIVLNEVPNSNGAMQLVNNVCLTTMGTQQNFIGSYIVIMQKSRLTRDKR